MKLLTEEELVRAVETLPGWSLSGRNIERTFAFPSFAEAIDFVNGAARIAEEMGHHPDLDIRYNQVRVALTTHDSGGVTKKDLQLAQRLEGLQGRRVV